MSKFTQIHFSIKEKSDKDLRRSRRGSSGARLEAGTRLVVVVDPRRHTVAVYRGKESIRVLTAGEMLRGGEVVPGWEVAVEELFQ